MTIKIKSEEARTRWRDMMDAAITGEAVVIERYNRPQAALIDFETFVALQEASKSCRRIAASPPSMNS